VLDVLEVCGAESLRDGADATLAVGIAAGIGAAATGWADWSDTKDEPRTLGFLHALLNGAAIVAYAGSLALRRAGRRRTGVAVSTLALGVVAVGAYLGGELSLGMQLGVKHTAEPKPPPGEFVPVLSFESIADGEAKVIDVDGLRILLHRLGDDVRALSGVCTHRGGPLGDEVRDGCVTCPWHGSKFRLTDGSIEAGPATFPLARYEARVAYGWIELRRFGA